MKIVDLQSQNERKAYQAPLLKDLGEVKELTKGNKGSAIEDNTTIGDRENPLP
ncbi:hypothetical protein GCM10023091_19830 [Ravibacter arvi]|uniref:Lasso RiPP family leader peptide-containing protein n=1 Tax=Ravibacter arvi TaxID=2051041 RepID=A0ABP8LYC9_9BACT